MELFEKVVELGGRLLQVEWSAPSSGEANDETCASAMLLTFDVARILVTAKPGRSLELRQVESAQEAGQGLLAASEEEPWWRVLGNPLVRCQGEEGEGGGLRLVRLQFRADAENPRVIVLQLESGLVGARLETH